jgi:hypothetical protein
MGRVHMVCKVEQSLDSINDSASKLQLQKGDEEEGIVYSGKQSGQIRSHFFGVVARPVRNVYCIPRNVILV